MLEFSKSKGSIPSKEIAIVVLALLVLMAIMNIIEGSIAENLAETISQNLGG